MISQNFSQQLLGFGISLVGAPWCQLGRRQAKRNVCASEILSCQLDEGGEYSCEHGHGT